MPLIQQQHRSEVSNSLVREPRTGDELETLQLAEVSGIAQHMDVEEFRYVPTSGDKGVVVRGVFTGCFFPTPTSRHHLLGVNNTDAVRRFCFFRRVADSFVLD